MKYGKIVLAGVFLLIFITSCKRSLRGKGPIEVRSIQVSDFSKIRLEIPADVTIVIADSFNCAITSQANIIDAVKVDVSGNELTISSDYNFDDTNIEMVISLPGLKQVAINGSGNMKTLNVIKSKTLKLYINGSGSMDIDAEADKILAEINGSGSCKINGSAKSFDCNINGSGDLHGFDLASIESQVEINGSGDAEVMATDLLDASIRGSGNIFYKGSPHLKSEIVGSGTIKKSE